MNTAAFIKDLRARLVTVPQLYSDGWAPYVAAVGSSFAGSVDYAQVVKNYRRKGRKDDDHRYEPPRDPFITKMLPSRLADGIAPRLDDGHLAAAW